MPFECLWVEAETLVNYRGVRISYSYIDDCLDEPSMYFYTTNFGEDFDVRNVVGYPGMQSDQHDREVHKLACIWAIDAGLLTEMGLEDLSEEQQLEMRRRAEEEDRTPSTFTIPLFEVSYD